MSSEVQFIPDRPSRTRLDGWKDIANHFGVDQRTTQRWEREGMPVHRIGRTKKVFAYVDEIDPWHAARNTEEPIETGPTPQSAQPIPPTEPAAAVREPRPLLWWIIPALAASVAASLFAVNLLPTRPTTEPSPHIGRLFPQTTSEGKQPVAVSLSHRPAFLALSPLGDKLFATDGAGRTLSIIDTTKRSVTTVTLPEEAGPLAVSRNGKLYVGSAVEGIMTVDIESGRVLPGLISTGGPVRDLAITPDGGKLFLAMGHSGLKQLTLASGKLRVVSDRVCPENLEMDSQGKRLYVAYQCSGPTGRRAHDSVEIYDVEREISLGFVNGLPMVGSPPHASPDGKLVLLNGSDACSAPQYKHEGCQLVPSSVFYLLRAADRQILQSFTYPVSSRAARFLDDSRFLSFGNGVSVVDAAKYGTIERWDNAADCDPTDIVYAPNRHRAYLGCARTNKVYILQPESEECAPPQQGLAMFYSADGSTADAASSTELNSHGNVRFAPGKVGQSFYLDGSSYLDMPWTGHYQYGFHDFTIAMYAKFARAEGEMTLADWTAENPRRGILLRKSADSRVVFESWPGGGLVESEASVIPDTWYHLVVTRTGRDLILYVNGRRESRGEPPALFEQQLQQPLFLGAQSGIPSFQGWLDEIAFYNRALTVKEVDELYRLREYGPCKL